MLLEKTISQLDLVDVSYASTRLGFITGGTALGAIPLVVSRGFSPSADPR